MNEWTKITEDMVNADSIYKFRSCMILKNAKEIGPDKYKSHYPYSASR